MFENNTKIVYHVLLKSIYLALFFSYCWLCFCSSHSHSHILSTQCFPHTDICIRGYLKVHVFAWWQLNVWTIVAKDPTTNLLIVWQLLSLLNPYKPVPAQHIWSLWSTAVRNAAKSFIYRNIPVSCQSWFFYFKHG